MKNYKTLIISPHCDDEVLGCGGILNNRKNDKIDTFVYYLGVDLFHIVKRKDRIKEVENVSKFLNFDYKIGTNQVNNYDRSIIINEITNVINEIQPEEVFIPNYGSYNQDHKEVYDACIIALRPHDLNHFVPNVFVFEVDQYLLWGENEFEPNYFEPIDIENKISAYRLHKSQVREFRPEELLKSYSHIRGLSSQLEHAEAFKILRIVKK
jgi:N-acetylglucosamine malate deacetylase 1